MVLNPGRTLSNGAQGRAPWSRAVRPSDDRFERSVLVIDESPAGPDPDRGSVAHKEAVDTISVHIHDLESVAASFEDIAGPRHSAQSRHRETAERVIVLLLIVTEQRLRRSFAVRYRGPARHPLASYHRRDGRSVAPRQVRWAGRRQWRRHIGQATKPCVSPNSSTTSATGRCVRLNCSRSVISVVVSGTNNAGSGEGAESDVPPTHDLIKNRVERTNPNT